MDPEQQQQCHISTSWQTACQTDAEGQMRCETLKKIWKHCPGKPPELVQEERVQEEGNERSPFGSSGPPSLFRAPQADPHFGHAMPMDPFGTFQRMDELMGSFFGRPLFVPAPGAPPSQLPPGWSQAPPPRREQLPPQPPPNVQVHDL